MPQIKQTVLIIWVSQESGVTFHDEADTVFSHIVDSIRKADIQDCLIRTVTSQNKTGIGGAVVTTYSMEEDVYEKDPDGYHWDKVNDDALVQELSQLGI